MNKLTAKIALIIIVISMSLTACNNTNYGLTSKCDGCGAQTAFEVLHAIDNVGK